MNTNKKSDGFVGGQQLVVPVGNCIPGNTGATTDIQFTLLCLTVVTGSN
jgi:hypothetical protein